MIKGIRLAKIKEILYNVGSVKVDELSELMNVSLVTIRNDLRELEQEGFATRIHGGAIISRESQKNLPNLLLEKDYADVVSKNIVIPLTAERQIACVAKQMIKERSWIFLGCGSTCASIAQALLDQQVNVLTNSVLVASMLAQNPMANVLVTGGYLSGSYRSYMSGDVFENSIRNIRVDMAFFGTAAINFEQGFSVQGMEERSVYCAVKKISRIMIIVAGVYKYDKGSYFTLADLDEPDMVIADQRIPQKYKTFFHEHGVSFVTQSEGEEISKYGQEGKAS